MASALKLGPFTLDKRLAVGGMSEVWGAVHTSGVRTAIKVIPPELVADPHAKASLESEIRTAASLDHPGIIWLYDHGTIDAALAEASEHRLLAGSPYLALEYASHSLADMMPLRTWAGARTVTVGLLDALAHAHARGVVHRDLKPANVLVSGPSDLRPGLKLTDFGIAHALDGEHITGSRIVGTPRYMAPEQIDGGGASIGGWTDLYALGCLLYRAITGDPVFKSRGAALLMAHINEPPPRLVPPAGFPRQFTDWIAWLLEKNPGKRPSSAAAALQALPEGPLAALHPTDGGEDLPTRPLSAPSTVTLTLQAKARHERKRGAKPQILDVPKTWRRALPSHNPRLHDAGRAMFGMRPIPFVGREEERDALWSMLRQVSNRRQPAVVHLTGRGGLGRTRLLMWLAQRALELGCALDLAAWCDPGLPAGRIVQGMLNRAVRTTGTTGERRERRIQAMHERLDIEPGPLIGHALEDGADPQVVYAAVSHLAGQVLPLGTLLVTIDDLHHAPELVELVRALMTLRAPVLVVVTTSEEGLVGNTGLQTELRSLCTWSRTLGPMPALDHGHLIRTILPLSPSLAARVEERTQGNPRFAVQLVQDWVERDLLRVGPNGFDAAADLPLPPSIQSVWMSRVETLIRGLGEDASERLELAAVLGSNVVMDELYALVPQHPHRWDALAARLMSMRFAVPTPDGFAFAHAPLREVLIERAERFDRLQQHHQACAELLATSPDPADVVRRARHRVRAGDGKGAAEDLLEAALWVRIHVGISRALVLLDEAESVTDDLRTRAALMATRARILSSGGNHTAATRYAEDALALAESHGWAREANQARAQCAVQAYHRTEYRRCLELAEQITDDPDGDDPTALGIANAFAGWAWMMLGDTKKCIRHLQISADHYDRVGTPDGAMMALMGRVDCCAFTDDAIGRDAWMDKAWKLANDPPQPMHQVWLLERYAHFALEDGEPARALRRCEAMLAAFTTISVGKVSRLYSLLALSKLELGRRADAHREWLRLLAPDAQPESALERAILFAGLLASAPRTGSNTDAEAWLRILETILATTNSRHITISRLLSEASRWYDDPEFTPRIRALMADQPPAEGEHGF